MYNYLPFEVEGFESLAELALDIRWSWNHYADQVWHQLNPELWEMTSNPWVILQTVSPEQIEEVIKTEAFRKKVQELVDAKHHDLESPGWFQEKHADSALKNVVYFSMEFMLSEALPIYSGGLGNVAGDQLKTASDLGVPVIGVGLLYQQGYFRQSIDKDGNQQALYPYNDPGQLPITPLRDEDGRWLRLEIDLPGYSVWLRAWQVQVGRTKLYLLDSNDPANFPAVRGITSELYGGGSEMRLEQELLLGIGGWRLLEQLGIEPQICHLNEGHAAFAVLERARSFMEKTGQSFDVAMTATRAANLFTTHTAVPAGFDIFSPSLITQYLGYYAQKKLGITTQDLLALGRINPDDRNEDFNMAYLAIRGSGAINAVSELHGKVSREIFSPLFPKRPEDEVPIGHITNGVHMPSWDSDLADELWTQACGKYRWLGNTDELGEQIRHIDDDAIWKLRTASRKNLINYTRKRHAKQLEFCGECPEDIERVAELFDANIFTMGFARRFATYKRPNLLLHDRERFVRILTNPERPVQLIMAGKAHPADKSGQALIKEWNDFIKDRGLGDYVVFLSDYDMLLTEHLVQGVDVWLNTPRRPWEACGTSGMKVLVNGGINISELDGWWAEAYSPEVGWAIGDGREHGDDPAWDGVDANRLYDILEYEAIPEFYSRNESGVPVNWVARVRESMASLTPRFSANRAVREYTEKFYVPAAENFNKRVADDCEMAGYIADCRRTLDHKWGAVRFGKLNVQPKDGGYIFDVQVYLDNIDENIVSVELHALSTNGGKDECYKMERSQKLVGAVGGYHYTAEISTDRDPDDYTPRIVPCIEHAAVPLEASHILWQK
jgi:glycogen phosphorylase